jgi:prepilin-type processing-associated H-X9-DG protein
MKARRVSGCRGLKLIEALIVVAVLTLLLLAILLPALPNNRNARIRARHSCVNNLKQIGPSFRQWALDSKDEYPMNNSISNRGAMEWAQQGIAWPVFQVMSNELNTPKILVCPADKTGIAAVNFSSSGARTNLSYFVGLDAKEVEPQMFLTGDSDLGTGRTRFRSGIVSLATNRLVNFSEDRHNKQGHVGLADGSVQGYSNTRLREALRYTGNSENRIIIP